MYFICKDKKIIEPNVHMTYAYQYLSTAQGALGSDSNLRTHKIWDDKTKPLPQKSVEAFYLVPEKLFVEILQDHTDQDQL